MITHFLLFLAISQLLILLWALHRLSSMQALVRELAAAVIPAISDKNISAAVEKDLRLEIANLIDRILALTAPQAFRAVKAPTPAEKIDAAANQHKERIRAVASLYPTEDSLA